MYCRKWKKFFLVLPPWPVNPRPKRELKKEKKKKVANIVWSLEAFHKMQSNSWICIDSTNKIGNANSQACFLYKSISLHTQKTPFCMKSKSTYLFLNNIHYLYLSFSGSKSCRFLDEFCINYFNHYFNMQNGIFKIYF